MKYVLFSDVHGNANAFDAMLQSIRHENIQGFLFCGDITGYYYHAADIVKKMKLLPRFYAVRGNHDNLYLDAFSNKQKQQDAIREYGSSYQDLEEEVADYLRSIPLCRTLTLGHFRVSMVHGSPNAFLSDRIYPDTALVLRPQESDFLFLGHTHYQMQRSHLHNCQIVNPGSLGQPRDGRGFSYYMVDFQSGKVTQHCVDYDIAPLLDEVAQRDPQKPYLSNILKRKED